MKGSLRAISRTFIHSMLFSVALNSPLYAQQATPPAAAPTTPGAANATPASQSPIAPKAPTGVVGDRNVALIDRLPPEQMIALQAGTETFPARYVGDLSGLPRGAVIILHAAGQHPSWPFTVAALIDDLPLHGWSTLSIELPTPAQDATTASTTTAATPPNSAASGSTPKTNPAAADKKPPATNAAAPAAASVIAIEPQAQARITAAIKYLVDQKQTYVVLLGFGSGATRAAENVRQLVATSATKKTDPITALILIAPANRLIGLDQDLPKILPATELPTLDIILSSDPQALADAEERRRAVLHQRQRTYRRLELPPIASAESAQQSLMVRRVRAWLHHQTEDPSKEDDNDRDKNGK